MHTHILNFFKYILIKNAKFQNNMQSMFSTLGENFLKTCICVYVFEWAKEKVAEEREQIANNDRSSTLFSVAQWTLSCHQYCCIFRITESKTQTTSIGPLVFPDTLDVKDFFQVT